jgi:membrane-associated phospholipid phosphatase
VPFVALRNVRPVLASLALCGLLAVPARGQTDAPQAPGLAPTAPLPAGRDISWRLLPANFLRDQKDIFRFPVGVAQGRHWLPTVAITGVTAGLLAADPHDAPYFRRTATFQGFNRVFSGSATGLGVALAPPAFYVIGLIDKNSYQQQTALLAGEALVDTLFLYGVTKIASQRLRPSDIVPNGDFSDTFFRSRLAAGGFPSGHTITAFAVATVIAHRYRSHRWVPWMAYGAAGVVGFSRITLQSHFPADVFLGAALGYSVSRFAVLRF